MAGFFETIDLLTCTNAACRTLGRHRSLINGLCLPCWARVSEARLLALESRAAPAPEVERPPPVEVPNVGLVHHLSVCTAARCADGCVLRTAPRPAPAECGPECVGTCGGSEPERREHHTGCVPSRWVCANPAHRAPEAAPECDCEGLCMCAAPAPAPGAVTREDLAKALQAVTDALDDVAGGGHLVYINAARALLARLEKEAPRG